MVLDLLTVQHLLTALLNLATAVLTGASVARLWLCNGATAWAEERRQPIRKLAILGVLVAMAANLVLLWVESASMAEVPLSEAGAATWSMLTATHLGLAWSIGMGGLVLAACGVILQGGQGKRAALLPLASLAAFWYTRAMVSHAAGKGDFSLAVLADWLHLGLINLWVGEVAIAGAFMLRGADPVATADRRARAAYVASLSSSATLALAGIFITGLYASWRNLDGFGNLAGTPYGSTLMAKLLLVGIAAMLGGFNRFFVMPPWLARESAGRPAPAVLPVRFRRILWIEALLLVAAVVLAAWLASTPPPGEQM